LTSFPETLALSELGRKRALDVEDWAEIRRLRRSEGMSISQISRVVGLARNTVKAALESDGPPRYQGTSRHPCGAVDRHRAGIGDRSPIDSRPWPAELTGGLAGRGSPRLVLVRQPDHLGVEGAHPQLSYGMRLVELAERHRQVADDDDRARPSLNDDHL